jgi:ADP-ribosyl-[dinitrogen reductase] hydrolase
MLDKIKGGLFGVAIGDALGGTTEFMTEAEIKDKYGRLTKIIAGGCWDLKPGETTDDTAMTIAVAKGILNKPEDPIPSIGEEFLKWFSSNPKDVGNTVTSVLSQFQGDWNHAAKTVCLQMDGKCAGNGSLMRTLPVALAYPSTAKMLEITYQQSMMTHYDEETAQICQLYNKIATRLLDHVPIRQAIKQEISVTKYSSIFQYKPAVPPDGYVVNTFYWVLYYLYHFESFEDVAIEAANKGGDSDTIAAIACGLKGIEVGFANLPEDFKDKILVKDELDHLATKIYQLRTKPFK